MKIYCEDKMGVVGVVGDILPRLKPGYVLTITTEQGKFAGFSVTFATGALLDATSTETFSSKPENT